MAKRPAGQDCSFKSLARVGTWRERRIKLIIMIKVQEKMPSVLFKAQKNNTIKNIISVFVACITILASCAPSNIKKVIIAQKSQKVYLLFDGYNSIKLKKADGFNSSVLYYIEKLDTVRLGGYDNPGMLFYVSSDPLSKHAYFYSEFPECNTIYNKDSTVLMVEGLINGKGNLYEVMKSTTQGYTIALTYFSRYDSIPVSPEEKIFANDLLKNISILKK